MIDTHANNAGRGGEVLPVTQQAFARLDHFRNAQDLHLVDEIPQVHAGSSVRLAQNNYQLPNPSGPNRMTTTMFG